MELGNKIKTLRLKAGLTQEMLAEELGVSFQTISKWENSICAPDISMLPKLSVFFGVTIDELFDLTIEQRLYRIEKMIEMGQELSQNTFSETVEVLQNQLEVNDDKAKINSLLAHVYHHRMLSDSSKVSKYARRAMELKPDVKDTQWLLQKAEGANCWDWNVANHHEVISFYKTLVENNPSIGRNYLYLMDNLLADRRTEEVRHYLEVYRSLQDHNDVHVYIYEAEIALAEYNFEYAQQKYKELEEHMPQSGIAMFEIANFYVRQCKYDKAIAYYEKSFVLDNENGNRPVYTDALEGIAIIYEIQEAYEQAIKTYDRILKLLEEEWNYTEGEPVQIIMDKKQRLMNKLIK